jgi:SAM-dependent methyltransferase
MSRIPWPIQLMHRIAGEPAIYNLIQRAAGLEVTRARLAKLLGDTSGVLLDVGAGTGLYVDLLPAGTRYVWLDNDVEKLRGFRTAYPGELAVLSDAGRMAIREESVDYALSVALSHHLTDAELDGFLASVARICRRGFIFLDAVERPESVVSRALWKYDRGSHPRKLEDLRRRLERYFIIETESSYRIYHTYLLCRAVPRLRVR